MYLPAAIEKGQVSLQDKHKIHSFHIKDPKIAILPCKWHRGHRHNKKLCKKGKVYFELSGNGNSTETSYMWLLYSCI